MDRDEPDSDPDDEADPQSDTDDEPDPESAAKPDPDTESDDEPDPEPDPDDEPEPDPDSPADAVSFAGAGDGGSAAIVAGDPASTAAVKAANRAVRHRIARTGVRDGPVEKDRGRSTGDGCALRAQKVGKTTRTGLTQLYASQLSGGERTKVAIDAARAPRERSGTPAGSDGAHRRSSSSHT